MRPLFEPSLRQTPPSASTNCPPDGACRPFSCHKPRLAGSWAFTPSPACGRGRGVRVGPFRQNAPIYKTFNSKEYGQNLVGMDTSLSPTLSRKRERESNPHQCALCLNHRCVKHHPAQPSTARQTALTGHFRATSPVWRAVWFLQAGWIGVGIWSKPEISKHRQPHLPSLRRKPESTTALRPSHSNSGKKDQ